MRLALLTTVYRVLLKWFCIIQETLAAAALQLGVFAGLPARLSSQRGATGHACMRGSVRHLPQWLPHAWRRSLLCSACLQQRPCRQEQECHAGQSCVFATRRRWQPDVPLGLIGVAATALLRFSAMLLGSCRQYWAVHGMWLHLLAWRRFFKKRNKETRVLIQCAALCNALPLVCADVTSSGAV